MTQELMPEQTDDVSARTAGVSNHTDGTVRGRLGSVSSRFASAVSTGLSRAADRVGRLASERDDGSNDDPADELSLEQLIERAGDIQTVMVTTVDERGTLSSRPLTVQRIADDGDLAFIVDRNAEWVTQAVEPINVAFVDGSRTWISVAGRMTLDDDRAALDELWDPMTDAFFPDGKDDGPIVLRVLSDRWEYWTAPNRAIQLIEVVRAKFGDGSTDLGDSGSVET
jgi:general stress protein 26